MTRTCLYRTDQKRNQVLFLSLPLGHIPTCPESSPYQTFDDFQKFLHNHSNALVTQESADRLEMRGPHEVPVGAVDVAVGNVEGLENRGGDRVRDHAPIIRVPARVLAGEVVLMEGTGPGLIRALTGDPMNTSEDVGQGERCGQ